MSEGACVLADGPLLEFSLQHNGRTARMGDLLTIRDGGGVVLKAGAHTTAEFGGVEKVRVVIYSRAPGSQASSAKRRDSSFLGRWGALVAGW